MSSEVGGAQRQRVRHRTGGRRRDRRSRARLIRRRILIGVAVVLGVVVLWGAWVGIRGVIAKQELEAAMPSVPALKDAVLAQDFEAAQRHADSLALHTAAARGLTDDVLWRAAEVLPWVGPNLTVVRELAASADSIAIEVVPPLLEIATSVTPERFAPVDGRFDLAPLTDAQPTLATAAAAADAATALVIATNDLPVIDALATAREQYLDQATEARDIVVGIATASELLPAALGADGPRSILLLFQNNAELRATGGIPGALALITATDGAIDLTQQASSSDFRFDGPIAELDLVTRAIYTDRVATYIQNVNLTPRFDVGAPVAAQMWQRVYGTPIDMVVAVDPIVLAGMLRATGPVTLPNGDVITADNVVTTLLADVYARFPNPRDQDDYFALVAATVFERLSAGGMDPKALISAMTSAAEQRRILVWSAHEAEQAVLGATSLGGQLPVQTDDAKEFGIYFNDATGSKMDVHLQISLGTAQVNCRNDGRPEYVIEVSMANPLTVEQAAALPEYVTGGGSFGTRPGDIRTNVYVYGSAPSYGFTVLRDGEPTQYHPFLDEERPASGLEVLLAPGESTVLRFHYLGDTPGALPAKLINTPFVYETETHKVAFSCEDALS